MALKCLTKVASGVNQDEIRSILRSENCSKLYIDAFVLDKKEPKHHISLVVIG